MGLKPNISQEMKQNILDDLDLGYTFGDIADRYNVSFSTIRRVKNSKSSEAPTAMDSASEDITDSGSSADTNIIPDVPEAVKPAIDYEEQKAYIADILRCNLHDIEDEIRSFEERIQQLKDCLEERQKKQRYLRDFIRSMK